MSTKPITPYARLLDAITRFQSRVLYPKTRTMFLYPANRLNEGWSLVEVYHRVQAADSLGYDVKVIANQEGLKIQYVERPGEVNYPL